MRTEWLNPRGYPAPLRRLAASVVLACPALLCCAGSPPPPAAAAAPAPTPQEKPADLWSHCRVPAAAPEPAPISVRAVRERAAELYGQSLRVRGLFHYGFETSHLWDTQQPSSTLDVVITKEAALDTETLKSCFGTVVVARGELTHVPSRRGEMDVLFIRELLKVARPAAPQPNAASNGAATSP